MELHLPMAQEVALVAHHLTQPRQPLQVEATTQHRQPLQVEATTQHRQPLQVEATTQHRQPLQVEIVGTPPSVPTPSTPSNPPRGGGYYPTPPTTVISPPTPVIVSPPSTPSITPGTPFTPTPPFIPDPNSPFSCNYWRTHPAIIWGVLGWWGTTGNAFGVSSLPGFGSSMTVQQALSNTRTDGYGTLYREGTASLLNSMVSNKFHFTTRQVRENFISALVSNKAAGAQGQLFKLANEGRLKPRA
ncbi:PROTODERMAL FACTOR 1 [Salix koriyanagi]|uniref:PROTODERMAL FACTOR 1 n=1 Tax=Salix koriyanagi TaxID=2511006 RepID=A0A9Q0SL60_9ROSI|nr:PROTODERMAL FACTOR 1 [Salix koriyanagi]